MKNKKLNKILLPLVGLIWLAVAFRFFGSEKEGDNLSHLPSTSFALLDSNLQRESFSLLLDYRDPFLDRPADLGMEKQPVSPPSVPTSPILRLEKIQLPQKIDYPKVSYLGGVKSETDTRGLVQIDGKILQVKKGEEVQEVSILDLNLDQILVQFKDSSWTVRKK